MLLLLSTNAICYSTVSDYVKYNRKKQIVKFIAKHLNMLFYSMTQLLSHTFAHLTGPFFRLKAKLLPSKKNLGLK